METIRNYGIALAVFFAFDILWLGFISKKLYAKHLGYIMAGKTNWPAAIIFYLLYIAGLIYFVLNPALDKNSLGHAFTAGAIYGFMTYATYDMTNLATLKDWPLLITAVDIAWGTFLNAMTAGASFYIIILFK